MEKNKANILKERSELLDAIRVIANSTSETTEALLKECKKIEQKAIKLSDDKILYEIYYQEAELYRKMNIYPQALYHYHLSLQHVTDSEQELLANLHHKIGIIHWYMGRYDNALEHFHKNLAYWTDLSNDKSIANALSNIGTIYNRTERFDEALKYFQQALEIRKKIHDEKGIAITLNNIGIAYENKKDLEKALSYHTESLKIKTTLQDEEGSGVTLFNIGEIYFEKNEFDTAIEIVNQALQIFMKHDDAWKIVNCHHLLGKILIGKVLCKEAENEFVKAMKRAEKIEAIDLLKMIYQSLSEFYLNEKKYKKALHYYQLFTEVKDKIFNENSSKKMMMLESKMEVERAEKEAEIYRLKNIELANANELVKVANQQLTETNERLQNEIDQRNKAEVKIHSHQEHLQLINTILRHDLTNNLAVIKSAVKIFHQTKDNNLLQNIDNYVNKSVSLIKKMREMEKLITENKNLNSYQVSKIINQITKNYPTASICLQGDAYILADDTIFSIFDNLIGNAIKHAESPKIDLKVIQQKNYVEIRIMDYGIGIPEQIFDKIFEKDYTYGKCAGSGLGLHIVKKAMESISGGVFVEKNEPCGTVFVLLFRGVDI